MFFQLTYGTFRYQYSTYLVAPYFTPCFFSADIFCRPRTKCDHVQAISTSWQRPKKVQRNGLHPLQWLRPLQGDAKAKIHIEITRCGDADKPPQLLRELCDCQGLHQRWCVMCHVEIILFAWQTAQMSPKMISERMEGAEPCHDYKDKGAGPDGCW